MKVTIEFQLDFKKVTSRLPKKLQFIGKWCGTWCVVWCGVRLSSFINKSVQLGASQKKKTYKRQLGRWVKICVQKLASYLSCQYLEFCFITTSQIKLLCLISQQKSYNRMRSYVESDKYFMNNWNTRPGWESCQPRVLSPWGDPVITSSVVSMGTRPQKHALTHLPFALRAVSVKGNRDQFS